MPLNLILSFTLGSWSIKTEDITRCVLPEVRLRAGLNNPLALFTTNCSESLNNVIKMEVDWKESKLPLLVEHLQAIGDRQNAELERAVISRGEWSFLSEYRDLIRSETQWFSHMAPEAKKRHLKKIFNMKPICAQQGTTSPPSVLASSVANTQSQKKLSSETTNQHGLSVGWKQCSIMNVSESTLQNIWRKAEQLVTSPQKQILSVPWASDHKARLVKSSSTPQPHMVSSDPINDKIYRCDDKWECTRASLFVHM